MEAQLLPLVTVIEFVTGVQTTGGCKFEAVTRANEEGDEGQLIANEFDIEPLIWIAGASIAVVTVKSLRS